MAISDQLVEDAIDIIASIEGIEMNHDELVDDVILVAYVFDEEIRFKTAIAQITHSLKLIINQRRIGQALVSNYEGWWSFHFQSRRIKRTSQPPWDVLCNRTAMKSSPAVPNILFFPPLLLQEFIATTPIIRIQHLVFKYKFTRMIVFCEK